MLTLDHISKTFNPGTINEKRALDGLSLHLKPGDFVTVIGGNGAGDFFFRRTEFPPARQLPRKPPKFDRKVCAVFLPENTHKHRNL